MVSRPEDETPLALAHLYLQLMRKGEMEDSTGETFYFEEFDEAVHNSGMPREDAYAALGTSETEVNSFYFVHKAEMVKNALEDTQRKIEEGAPLTVAYLDFMDVYDFVNRNDFGVPPKDAMVAIDLSEDDYNRLLDHFESLMDTLADARQDAEDQIRRQYPFDDDGLCMN